MDTQARNTVPSDGWRTGPSKAAGLYGELPPLMPRPPFEAAPAARPLRKSVSAD
jgi:hypothetical protein